MLYSSLTCEVPTVPFHIPTCKVRKGTRLGTLKSRALPIYMARQTSGLTVCKWKTKPMYGMVFVPEPCVSFAQMRSIYWKGACKSRKQVSKMSIEQIDGEFPFGTFGWNKQDYMYFFYMFCCFWKCTFQAHRNLLVNERGTYLSHLTGSMSMLPNK